MPPTDLAPLFDELNQEYFAGVLPNCPIEWSRRLTRAAGVIYLQKPLIRLSVPLLFESYQASDAQFQVCGVSCHTFEQALREILKHEMIHLWLHTLQKPSGHTAEFRAKARQIGQPKTRHGIALPAPKSGWIYRCLACQNEFLRRRRYGRAVACAGCCKTHNKGRFDARFQLHGRKIKPPGKR